MMNIFLFLIKLTYAGETIALIKFFFIGQKNIFASKEIHPSP